MCSGWQPGTECQKAPKTQIKRHYTSPDIKMPLFRGAFNFQRERERERFLEIRKLFNQQLAHPQAGLVQTVAGFVLADSQTTGDAGMVVTFHVMHQEDHFLGIG